uniref:Uncharacterized protein n=1 Tax=Meloidogyne incognita TaxID=6306 RepID=A0A914KR98_MELIC
MSKYILLSTKFNVQKRKIRQREVNVQLVLHMSANDFQQKMHFAAFFSFPLPTIVFLG